MSSKSVRRTRELAENTAIDAAWAQWSTLISAIVPDGNAKSWSLVDPEALVFVSLALSPRERRLEDAVAAWARAAGFLMSKPRLKSVAEMFPPGVGRRAADFARYAVEGGDRRWKNFASSTRDQSHVAREKQAGPLSLRAGPALVLRLRAGFGVNAKADLLGTLLGLGGSEASLKLLTSATAYSQRMIRTATKEMTLAGLIHEIEGRPSSFYLDPQPWARVLQTRRPKDPGNEFSIPDWKFWAALYGFLCGVQRWGQEAEENEWTDYVASSKARDLFEEHRQRLDHAGIRVPGSDEVRGTEYLEAFFETVRRVREKTLENQ